MCKRSTESMQKFIFLYIYKEREILKHSRQKLPLTRSRAESPQIPCAGLNIYLAFLLFLDWEPRGMTCQEAWLIGQCLAWGTISLTARLALTLTETLFLFVPRHLAGPSPFYFTFLFIPCSLLYRHACCHSLCKWHISPKFAYTNMAPFPFIPYHFYWLFYLSLLHLFLVGEKKEKEDAEGKDLWLFVEGKERGKEWGGEKRKVGVRGRRGKKDRRKRV